MGQLSAELAFYKALQTYNATLGFLADKQGTILAVTPPLCELCQLNNKPLTGAADFFEKLLKDNHLHWPLAEQTGINNQHIVLNNQREHYVIHTFGVTDDANGQLVGCAFTAKHGFEQLYQTLFSTTSNGVLIHSETGVIVDANPMACRILGQDRDNLIGRNIKELNKTAQIGFFDSDGILSTQFLWQYEFSYARPDGAILDIEAKCQKVSDTETNLIITEIIDVTSQRQSEQRIKLMLTAIEQSPSSIVITNTHGTIEYVNPQFTRSTGYTSHEAVGKNPNVLKTDITPKETFENLWQTLLKGEVWQGEFVNRKKDGTIYFEEAVISPITNKDGQTVHYLAIKHDVSKLKKQSTDLKSTVARLNALIESTTDRIWSIDNEFRITAINSHYKKDYQDAFGVVLNEGSNCLQGSTKDIEKEWMHRYKRALRGEAFSAQDYFDLPPIQKWVQTNFNPIVSEGEILGAALFSRDISDIKQTELNHLANQARLKSLIDNTSDSIWSVDRDYRILAVNSPMFIAFKAAYGFELEHGKSVLDALPIPLQQNWKARYDRALTGESFSVVDFFELQGMPFYYETSYNPIEFNGKIEGVSCFSRDITNQKRYEQNLKESEEQLQTIFNTVESGICLVNTENNTITYVNGYLSHLLNIPKDQLEGQPSSLLTFKESTNIASKQAISISNAPDVLLVNGVKEIPVVRSQSKLSMLNKPYILHSLIDISAQKEQEIIIKKLNASALRLISFQSLVQIHRYLRQELIGYLPDSIILLNLFNPKKSTMKVKAIESINGSLAGKFKDIIKVNPIGIEVVIPNDLLAQLKKGRLFEHEAGLKALLTSQFENSTIDELRTALGITQIYSIGISYQNNVFGSIVVFMRNHKTIEHPYYIETLMYQTSVAWQRNLLEKELVEAKTEAEKANHAKSAFVANLGHEIRTPLNAVIGLSDILYKTAQDPTSQNYLASIISSGKTVLNIINDLLDLSKIEAGEMVINPHPTDIRTLAEEMRHIFGLKAQEKGIELRLDIVPNLPLFINIDDLRLRQVLLNLIDNALKFTHKGFVEIKLWFTPKDAGTIDLNIEVTDTGIGIRHDMQHKVFLAFRQQDDQDNRKYGGTGLGLAIALKLVKMMGGRLTLKSEPGKGSCFTIEIPNLEVLSGYIQPLTDAPSVETTYPEPMPNLLPNDWDGNLPQLRELIDTEILPLLLSFNTKSSLQDAELFAQIIISVGEHHGIGELKRQGEKLQSEVANFDIIEMRQTLKQIKGICLRLLEIED